MGRPKRHEGDHPNKSKENEYRFPWFRAKFYSRFFEELNNCKELLGQHQSKLLNVEESQQKLQNLLHETDQKLVEKNYLLAVLLSDFENTEDDMDGLLNFLVNKTWELEERRVLLGEITQLDGAEMLPSNPYDEQYRKFAEFYDVLASKLKDFKKVEEHRRNLERILVKKDKAFAVKEQLLAEQARDLAIMDDNRIELAEILHKKDHQLTEKEKRLVRKDESLKMAECIQEKLTDMVKEKSCLLRAKNQLLTRKSLDLQEMNLDLANKKHSVKVLKQRLKKKNTLLDDQVIELIQAEEECETLKTLLKEKDEQLEKKTKQLAICNAQKHELQESLGKVNAIDKYARVVHKALPYSNRNTTTRREHSEQNTAQTNKGTMTNLKHFPQEHGDGSNDKDV